MPKISIIVPVCNVEKYLSKCLDSIVNQTLKDIEIMLDLAYDRKSAINPFENKAGNKSMYNYEEIIKLLTN